MRRSSKEMLQTTSRTKIGLQSLHQDPHRHGPVTDEAELPREIPNRLKEAGAHPTSFQCPISILDSEHTLEQKARCHRQNEEQPDPVPFKSGERDIACGVLDIDRMEELVVWQSWFS